MLYDDLEALRKFDSIKELPDYIAKNLNAKFKLREYQIQAFENFIAYFENNSSPRPLQVLFHMATGSGKTLIMAGLMIYLYKQGYRNFLFFVNLTNILDKTKENFLDSTSAKYLFAEEIELEGEKIKINIVENFQSIDDKAINICFETTQGLHQDIFFAKENSITIEDFQNYKVVFIADEAHHLNANTRGSTDNQQTWEQTIKTLFKSNAENILLEFTATCNIEKPEIKAEYADKIIFDYSLFKFYKAGYSKDIFSLYSTFSAEKKALQAIILSQYRLKLFQKMKVNVKPLVLFKSAKIADSKNFMTDFFAMLKNLDGKDLENFFAECDNPAMEKAKKYFAERKITCEMLARDLQEDFSESHCISMNDEKDLQKNQTALNSLEDEKNQYRAIFEVKKLDEGWDVLNLFDIVKLYKTSSSGRRPSATTISEAQLIGRGARYYPFQVDAEQPKFQRKYDSDEENKFRICETLFYHCEQESNYIKDLKLALKEIGFDEDKIIRCEYKLKDSFKDSDFYKHGKIFLNSRKEKTPELAQELSPSMREKIYNIQIDVGASGLSNLMTESDSADIKINSKENIHRRTFKDIAAQNYSLVHSALRKFSALKFNQLQKIFPQLTTTREFITGEKFLGDVEICIRSQKENLTAEDLYFAVSKVLKEISASMSLPQKEYEGTKEFLAHDISKIFAQNKTVAYSKDSDGELGKSQRSFESAFRIDLSAAEWFAHEDNFGTSEEKAFVKYFAEHYDELKKSYSKIFLVRNERQFKVYSFKGGNRFEPDFVLLLQKKDNDKIEQWQIFIEPKGKHLIEHDSWKEDFLLELEEKAEVVFFSDDKEYKILGFHFFNQERQENFNNDFKKLFDEE